MVLTRLKSAFVASILLSLIANSVLPQVASAKQIEAASTSEILAQKPSNSNAFYQRARKELPKDVYLLYRVVERMARANKLDSRPWRIGIVASYDINAFATESNLIAVYDGILDQLDGDPDALACTIGHEMGHHIKQHIAVGQAEKEKIYENLKAEAEKEAGAEAEDARRDANAAGAGSVAARTVGGFIGGGLGGLIGGLAGSSLENERQQRIVRAQQRIDTIYATKKAQIEEKWTALNHKQEFEADEQGYLLATTAGFDPQGCVRAMNILNSIAGSQKSSDSHPATPERIAALKTLITSQPASPLVAEGKANLAAHNRPLTYDLSRDNESLRINSYRGSKDIDQQLPFN